MVSLSNLPSGFQMGVNSGEPWQEIWGGHEVGVFILPPYSSCSSCQPVIFISISVFLSLCPPLSVLITAHIFFFLPTSLNSILDVCLPFPADIPLDEILVNRMLPAVPFTTSVTFASTP